jgi:hypothetical protein
MAASGVLRCRHLQLKLLCNIFFGNCRKVLGEDKALNLDHRIRIDRVGNHPIEQPSRNWVKDPAVVSTHRR